MRKALSALVLMAAPALVLSACNSSSGTVPSTPGMQPNSRIAAHGSHKRPHDFNSADLHAGGATFPAYAYNLGNQPTGCAVGTAPSCGTGSANPQQPPGTGSLFDLAPTTGTIYYCLTGSGFGRAAFTNPNGKSITGISTQPCAPLGASPTGMGGRVDPLDFVGSDQAMVAADYVTYNSDRGLGSSLSPNQGEPFEFPAIGGAITYGYRPKDLGKILPNGLKLSTWSLCAIANGTISTWNDPAIAQDNGVATTALPNKTITFYFRSDGSGTSYNFQNYLAANCVSSWPAPYNAAPYEGSGHSAAWTYGSGTNWNGPGSGSVPNANFIGESGNPGVLAAIQSTPYGTGYVESAWARSASPAVLTPWIQSGLAKNHRPYFVNAVSQPARVALALAGLNARYVTYGESGDVPTPVSLGSTRPDCILFINPSHFAHTAADTFPIVGVSYLMFYGKNNAHYADDKALISWLTGVTPSGSSPANAAMIKTGYVPLSAGIHQAIRNALNGHGHSTSPCLAP